MENKFYKVMSNHSDEELLFIYKKKDEYTLEAIAAMEFVLLERNLIQEATEQTKALEKEETILEEEAYNKFQRLEFGKLIPDATFAKENLIDSIYFQGFISPMHSLNWLNHLFIIFGIIGLVLSIILLGIGDFHSPADTLLTISMLFAILLPLGIWKLSKNKAKISVIKRMRSNLVTIKGSKDDIEIQLPFRYACYWEWQTIRYSLKQVKLNIFIFNDKQNTVIVMSELQQAQKSPPPHWDHIPADNELKALLTNKKVFNFNQHGIQKPFLYRFEKILSGLHTDSDELNQ